MKRLLLLLLAVPCAASGPKYVGSKTDALVYQEFQNAYHDIANPVITYAKISSATVTTLNGATYYPPAVYQVAWGSATVQNNFAGSSFGTTNLKVSITPLSTSHHIRVIATGVMYNSTDSIYCTIERNAGGSLLGANGGAYTDATHFVPVTLMVPYDAPASTSAQTYTVYCRNSNNATTVFWGDGTIVQTISAEEIP